MNINTPQSQPSPDLNEAPMLDQAPMLEQAESPKLGLPAAIEVITDQVNPELFVADRRLPVREFPTDPNLSALIPQDQQFKGFVQDQATVKTILNIASGVQSGSGKMELSQRP